MDRASSPRLPRQRRWRWLTRSLSVVGSPFLALGCAQPMSVYQAYGPPPAIPHAAQLAPAPPSDVVQASHSVPAPVTPAASQSLPITFDAVLRLAEQSNARIGLAREKLHESEMLS